MSGEMTVREMARKGGLSTAAKYGPEYMARIGRLGGKVGGPRGKGKPKRRRKALTKGDK